MFSEEIEIVISLLQYVSNSWVCSGGGDGDGSVVLVVVLLLVV